jgi:hypothetical protein
MKHPYGLTRSVTDSCFRGNVAVTGNFASGNRENLLNYSLGYFGHDEKIRSFKIFPSFPATHTAD